MSDSEVAVLRVGWHTQQFPPFLCLLLPCLLVRDVREQWMLRVCGGHSTAAPFFSDRQAGWSNATRKFLLLELASGTRRTEGGGRGCWKTVIFKRVKSYFGLIVLVSV